MAGDWQHVAAFSYAPENPWWVGRAFACAARNHVLQLPGLEGCGSGR
jgi:hypothetical protein